MGYPPPVWGIWSGRDNKMVAHGFGDLDEAKKRIWDFFDQGDTTVTVTDACPEHPERQLSLRRLKGFVYCRRNLIGGTEHEVEF